MRAVFGVLSLLIVVAVIGLLAKKQLVGLSGAGTTAGASLGVSLPVSTPQQQNQQLQNQVKKSVEAAMQQARPEPDEK
jgi:hypothetical protein